MGWVLQSEITEPTTSTTIDIPLTTSGAIAYRIDGFLLRDNVGSLVNWVGRVTTDGFSSVDSSTIYTTLSSYSTSTEARQNGNLTYFNFVNDAVNATQGIAGEFHYIWFPHESGLRTRGFGICGGEEETFYEFRKVHWEHRSLTAINGIRIFMIQTGSPPSVEECDLKVYALVPS